MAPLLSLRAEREKVGMAGCLNCELSQLPLVFQTAVDVGERYQWVSSATRSAKATVLRTQGELFMGLRR